MSSANTEDDAMKDYTKKLLPEGSVVVDANNPSCVILKKLAFVVEGRDDLEIDLTGDLSIKPKFDIKEGIKFKIRIDFMVQVIQNTVLWAMKNVLNGVHRKYLQQKFGGHSNGSLFSRGKS